MPLGDNLRVELSLPPCGSILLTLENNPIHYVSVEEGRHSVVSKILPIHEFEFERSEENILVLDRMGVSYNGGKTFIPEDMEHRVRKNVLSHFKAETLLEWQPWVAARKQIFNKTGGEIILRYKFFSDLEQPKCFAVIEDIQKGQLSVNGNKVDTTEACWHWDRGFGKTEITSFVRKGNNTVDFKVHYDFLTEIEQIYIIGDFGVELTDPYRAKITSEPEKLNIGSWTSQGFPFYPGRMTYKAEFTVEDQAKMLLRLIRPSGTMYKIRVNGQKAGRILWRPYEFNITQFCHPGINKLEIEVISSLQNAWGPLHEKTGDDNQLCVPCAFEDEAFIREEISLFPYGLLGGAEIVHLVLSELAINIKP